jgi:hypothetical protein
MKRYTHESSDKQYLLDIDQLISTEEGFTGDAVALLARFEDFYHDLLSDQIEIARQLEELKTMEKTKTLRYKELFTQKLINQNFLIHLRKYGFDEE